MKKIFMLAAMAAVMVSCGKKTAETQNAEAQADESKTAAAKVETVEVEMPEVPAEVLELIPKAHSIDAKSDVRYNFLYDTNGDGKNEVLVRVYNDITEEYYYDIYSLMNGNLETYAHINSGYAPILKDDYFVTEVGAMFLEEGVKSATNYKCVNAIHDITKNVKENGEVSYRIFPEDAMSAADAEALVKKLDGEKGTALADIKEWNKVTLK